MKTETVETTLAPSQLRLTADRTLLKADGRDVSVVTIEVKDKKGRTVPDACPLLTLTLEGEGRIIGAGNGDPAYPGPDHPQDPDAKTFSIPAFNGLAQVIVQTTRKAAPITLSCSSEFGAWKLELQSDK